MVATFVYYSTESKETKYVNVRVNLCEMLSADKRHACVNCRLEDWIISDVPRF